MSGIFGMNIKMAIYGESHGKSIGVVLDGLPPGLALDEAAIAAEMARRAPGQNALSTARKESDTVEIQSGFSMALRQVRRCAHVSSTATSIPRITAFSPIRCAPVMQITQGMCVIRALMIIAAAVIFPVV